MGNHKSKIAGGVGGGPGAGAAAGQWDSRVTSEPLAPTRKSRSAPVSAPSTVST